MRVNDEDYGMSSAACREQMRGEARERRLNALWAREAHRNLRGHLGAYPSAYRPEAPERMTRSQGCATDVLVPFQTPGETAFDWAARQRWELERRADAILAAATTEEWHPPMAWNPVLRLDVIDRWTRQLTVAPDRVAHRGTVRFKRPAIHRYGKGRSHWVAGTPDAVRLAAIAGPDALEALMVLPLGDEYTRVTLLTTHLAETGNGWAGCVGRGWLGAPYATKAAKRRRVTKARRAKAEGAGKRGPARSVWTIDASNVRKRWAKVSDTRKADAEMLETLLRTSAREAEVEYVTGHTVRVHQDMATVSTDKGHTFGIRDYARRAILAGWSVAVEVEEVAQ